MSLIFTPQCAPFSIAAAMLVGLTGIEMVTILLGFSISEFIGKPEGGHDGVEGGLLSWLNVGRVPILILLMLALGIFAALGFILQLLAGIFWSPLPASLAAVIVASATIPLLRASSRTMARLVPRDETYAVDAKDFIGRIAQVTLGPIDCGLPGRVKVKDVYGNWHQLRTRAAEGYGPIDVGANVLLVDLKADIYIATPAPSDLS